MRSLEPALRLEIRLASSRNRPLPPAARVFQQLVREFYAEASLMTGPQLVLVPGS
jgi:hypothetical protein